MQYEYGLLYIDIIFIILPHIQYLEKNGQNDQRDQKRKKEKETLRHDLLMGGWVRTAHQTIAMMSNL